MAHQQRHQRNERKITIMFILRSRRTNVTMNSPCTVSYQVDLCTMSRAPLCSSLRLVTPIKINRPSLPYYLLMVVGGRKDIHVFFVFF